MNLLGLAAETKGDRSATDYLAHLRSTSAVEVVRHACGRYRRAVLHGVSGQVIDDAIAGDPAARKQFVSMSWPDVPEWQRSLRFLLGGSPEPMAEALIDAFQHWHDVAIAQEEARLADAQKAVIEHLAAESGAWHADALLRRVLPDVDYDPPADLESMTFVPVSSTRPLAIILDHGMDTMFLFDLGAPSTPDTPPERLVQLGKALADPLRLRALRILATGPHTLGDLAAELGVPRTSLAHHISVLRAAGLLTHTIEDGRWGRLTLRADAVADIEPMFRDFVATQASGRRRDT